MANEHSLPAHFFPGAIVGETYVVDRKVGSGTFGEVWSGTDRSTGEKVALKKLLADAAADSELEQRFQREAYFLGRIDSDYVAKVVNFSSDPVYGAVLVLKFIEGDPLSKLFDDRLFTVEESIHLGVDLLSGLRDLHQARIIHRDLKPANIIMTPIRRAKLRAVICDFSLSRLAERRGPQKRGRSLTPAMRSLTPTNMTLGTIHYMAPEQVLSSRDVTERSDIYAVGAILYRGIIGTHTFADAGSVRSFVRSKLIEEAPRLPTGRTDGLAQGLEEIVAKALRRRPADRYSEAKEMLSDLIALAKTEGYEVDTPASAPILSSKASPLLALTKMLTEETPRGDSNRPPGTPSGGLAKTRHEVASDPPADGPLGRAERRSGAPTVPRDSMYSLHDRRSSNPAPPGVDPAASTYSLHDRRPSLPPAGAIDGRLSTPPAARDRRFSSAPPAVTPSPSVPPVRSWSPPPASDTVRAPAPSFREGRIGSPSSAQLDGRGPEPEASSPDTMRASVPPELAKTFTSATSLAPDGRASSPAFRDAYTSSPPSSPSDGRTSSPSFRESRSSNPSAPRIEVRGSLPSLDDARVSSTRPPAIKRARAVSLRVFALTTPLVFAVGFAAGKVWTAAADPPQPASTGADLRSSRPMLAEAPSVAPVSISAAPSGARVAPAGGGGAAAHE